MEKVTHCDFTEEEIEYYMRKYGKDYINYETFDQEHNKDADQDTLQGFL